MAMMIWTIQLSHSPLPKRAVAVARRTRPRGGALLSSNNPEGPDPVRRDLLQPDLAEIAGAAGVHRVHLSREFRRYFSTTVGEFLRRKRIEHACQLVSTTEMPLAEIAMTCGFSDQSHLARHFRHMLGTTPREFRWSQR